MFNVSRKLAYLIYLLVRTNEQFKSEVVQAVEMVNREMVEAHQIKPLPYGEIRAIARSIIKYVLGNASSFNRKPPRIISLWIEGGKPTYKAVREYMALSISEKEHLAGQFGQLGQNKAF